MPDHLPSLPSRPCPPGPPGELARNARRAGLDVAVIATGGACLACGTGTSTRWTEAALDGYGHRHGDTSALVVGWVCAGCLDDAAARAEASRKAAVRDAVRRPVVR